MATQKKAKKKTFQPPVQVFGIEVPYDGGFIIYENIKDAITDGIDIDEVYRYTFEKKVTYRLQEVK